MVDILQTKKKNILIIGYGSMGRKYEAILKKDYSVFFFDKKILRKKILLKN